MHRRRWLQILLCLAGLAAVTFGIISLYLPSPRWLIVGVKKRSGDVRVVEQHIAFLPPLQFYRLKFERRNGRAQRDGMIRITSRSEEHTSELQSLRHLVCRLLLYKN